MFAHAKMNCRQHWTMNPNKNFFNVAIFKLFQNLTLTIALKKEHFVVLSEKC